MELRIGRIMVEQGVLTEKQVGTVLDHQKREGKPFGYLCEHLFDVSAETVENAWAAQYAKLTRTVDPSIESFDANAVELITRRQAWQFRILPIRFDDSELMVATTQSHLRRALRFASSVIPVPLYFVMAEPHALGVALCKHYALPGMTPASVSDDALEHLLNLRSEVSQESANPRSGWMSKAG